MNLKSIFLFFTLVFLIQTASAAHYIIGIVNDAANGEIADGKQVVLWNPSAGINENLTDIIGPTGNSGAENVYMIDCEMMQTPCNVGDEVRIKVVKENEYTSYWVNLSVTGAGYDIAPNITLNSPPNAALVFPLDYSNFSDEVTFNCSASDFEGLSNITLYGNWSYGWHANETKSLTGYTNQTFFTKNLTEGKYQWSCMATDNVSISNFSKSNFTVTIDRTAPEIFFVYLNESQVCGQAQVRVNCSVIDALTDVNTVIIEARGTFWKNYTAELMVPGVYYSDITVNETGEWIFNCIANDSSGNTKHFLSTPITAYSLYPDIQINSFGINFSNNDPIENEDVLVEVTVFNDGCLDADNFLVGLYKNSGKINQIGNNKSISVPGRDNSTVNFTWDAEIGVTNFFAFADVWDLIFEENESNNEANNTLIVGAWQEIFGNVTVNKRLGDINAFNMTLWANASNLNGSIFVSDTESEIDWAMLQAIGKDLFGQETSDDFLDIDSLLGMGGFEDSTYILFTEGGVVRQRDDFMVHQNLVLGVPVINSTNNSNFFSGIMWDMSDDSDGEFSYLDAEDLVFVTKINRGALGLHGRYDYEITIPVRLRDYKEPDHAEVYLYYDLY